MKDTSVKRRPAWVDFVFNLKNYEKRDFGLDLIKVVAMFFVLSVHFFLYNGYYSITIEKPDFIFPTMVRDLFFICVPLFLLVSGALSFHRPATLSKKYYVKITPIIVNSVVIGLLVMFLKIFVLNQTNDMTPFKWAQSIWNFSQPSYGWYVNMYISLFVLMPILDAAYNYFGTQKQKTYMMIAIVFLTCLPVSINRWRVDDTSIGFSPNYFSALLWPAAYYIVGKYLMEFKPKINKFLLSVLLVLCLFYQAVRVFYTGKGLRFYDQGTIYADNGDLITLITGALFFLLLYDIHVKNKVVRGIFASVASLSLSVYLLSWIGDQFFYKNIYLQLTNGFIDYPLAYLKIIPLHFFLSVCAAYIVGIVVKLLSKGIMHVIMSLHLPGKKIKTGKK